MDFKQGRVFKTWATVCNLTVCISVTLSRLKTAVQVKKRKDHDGICDVKWMRGECTTVWCIWVHGLSIKFVTWNGRESLLWQQYIKQALKPIFWEMARKRRTVNCRFSKSSWSWGSTRGWHRWFHTSKLDSDIKQSLSIQELWKLFIEDNITHAGWFIPASTGGKYKFFSNGLIWHISDHPMGRKPKVMDFVSGCASTTASSLTECFSQDWRRLRLFARSTRGLVNWFEVLS
jgi:hypothetical protein